MNYLSDDILSHIIKFINCQATNKFFFINKKLKKLFFKHTSCYLLKYENLISCQTHPKCRKKVNVISQLLEAQEQLHNFGFVSTIHFNDLEEMRIAEPYIARFGRISHKCCNGIGVMYDIPLLEKKKPYSFSIYRKKYLVK